MSQGTNESNSERTNQQKIGADARHVAHAISNGWFARGVKLGLGFWVSGIVVVGVVFVLVLASRDAYRDSLRQHSLLDYKPPASYAKV